MDCSYLHMCTQNVALMSACQSAVTGQRGAVLAWRSADSSGRSTAQDESAMGKNCCWSNNRIWPSRRGAYQREGPWGLHQSREGWPRGCLSGHTLASWPVTSVRTSCASLTTALPGLGAQPG